MGASRSFAARPLRLLRGLLVVAGCCVVLLATADPARAAERVALVIGNSEYDAVGFLPNPVNDAEDIAAALASQNFDVTVLTNLTRDAMDRAIREFRVKADGADIAIVYYAGHGIEVDRRNYLIPIDATLVDQRDVPSESISLDMLLRQIQGARNLKMIVLDACRNNPYLKRMVTIGRGRAPTNGLAPVAAEGDNVLIAYAAAAGAVTPDGPAGANSPYTAAFLEVLAGPPRDVSLLMRAVRDAMRRRVGTDARPFVYASLSAQEIVLNPNGRGDPDAGKPASGAAGIPEPPAVPDEVPGPDDVPKVVISSIRDVQELLVRLGFKPGPINGKLGPAMRRALSRFQTVNGLDVTGILDKATLNQLRRSAGSPSGRTTPGDGDLANAPTDRPSELARSWSRVIGGPGHDYLATVEVLADGTLFVAGKIDRRDIGMDEAVLIHLGPNGTEVMRIGRGGGRNNSFNAIAALPDGALAIAGSAQGDGLVVVREADEADEANRMQRAIGGANLDWFTAIAALTGGDIALAGTTFSFGSSKDDDNGWVVRIGADGTERWRRFFDVSVRSVAALPYGELVLAGYTNHDRTTNAEGWVVRLHADGTERWRRTFATVRVPGSEGHAGSHFLEAVTTLPDGAIVLAGTANRRRDGGGDGWALRLDRDGNEVWQRVFGFDADEEQFNAVTVLPDGDIVVAGRTATGLNGDGWVIRLGPDGTERWRRRIGGPRDDRFLAVDAFPDGAIALVGKTESSAKGPSDGWVIRLGGAGRAP